MSSIQFYKDTRCTELADLGNSTGPPSGECTQFTESEWGSFRVVTLERTCAVTIYDRDVAFCSSSTLSVANFGACMSNATVNQFSVDCADYQIATSEPPASYVPPAATRSTVPSAPATASDEASPEDDGLSTGAKAGIGIGIAALVLLLIGLGVFLIIRRRRQARQQTAHTPSMSELRGDGHHPTEAPPHYSKHHQQQYDDRQKHTRTPNSAPVEAPGDHHWHGGLHEMESPSVTTGTEPRSMVGGEGGAAGSDYMNATR